jgi:hypothetical protein
MIVKRVKPSEVPLRYQDYKPSEWPGGHGDWVAEREEWNAAQEPVTETGIAHDGRSYAIRHGPLGDLTDLLRARREARLTDSTSA